MSEQRLIDANDIVKVAERAYNEWNLAMAAADGRREISLCFKRQDLCRAVEAVAKNATTINPETLPIVRELREKLAEYEPVHAHWEGYCTCSSCKRSLSELMDADSYFAIGFNADEDVSYCPFCGAKMDEKV